MPSPVRPWNDEEVRNAFPALAQLDDGVARVYVDAPGGTQVAGRVIGRMREALVAHCANDGGVFRTSRVTEERMLAAQNLRTNRASKAEKLSG